MTQDDAAMELMVFFRTRGWKMPPDETLGDLLYLLDIYLNGE